jgi:2-C-methyl-D-erythritol 4-phosphate cytidylyltransferase
MSYLSFTYTKLYLQAGKRHAIPAITAVDSMRIIKAEVNEPIDRNRLRIVQTPQTFHAHIKDSISAAVL